MKKGYVYILSNNSLVLYIGVTSNLIIRIHQHKNNYVDGFTKKYKVHRLVYYEEFDHIEDAIVREKQLKRWRRQWKLNLIQQVNPSFKDISEDFNGS